MRFEVLQRCRNIHVFCNVTSCRPVNIYRRFGEACCLFWDCFTLQMKAIRSFEMQVNIYQSARCNIVDGVKFVLTSIILLQKQNFHHCAHGLSNFGSILNNFNPAYNLKPFIFKIILILCSLKTYAIRVFILLYDFRIKNLSAF